jgi:hypothetical protein
MCPSCKQNELSRKLHDGSPIFPFFTVFPEHQDEGTRVLQEGFALFELLLVYHDPELARHLKRHDFPPALYLTPFLVTLFGKWV